MIIVKKTHYLIFKKLKFRCSLGKAGIKNKIKEGDNITPKGIFKLLKLYYRADKIRKIKTSLKKTQIKKTWDGVTTQKANIIIKRSKYQINLVMKNYIEMIIYTI